MCGIAGIAGRCDNAEQSVSDMIACMPYRGPNDKGVWAHDDVVLGHLRLSIIDVSERGHQPMFSKDGRFALVFNGEMYNYIELREELRKAGSDFFSESDSEVIIEAYRHFGPACTERFNGMWAFALYDTEEKTVFLSRDRFGVKPLFYSFENGCLRFASEMKALLRTKKEEPNWSYYYHFFDRKTPLGSDETVFSNIKHLRPAHSLLWKNGQIRIERYWHPDIKKSHETYSYDDTKDTFRTLFLDSVKLRLRSDVPIGVCLSGGLDSSAIAVALSHQGIKLDTFSSVYAESEYSEERFIDLVNTATHATSHKITPRSEDFFPILEEIIRHHDEPVRMPGTYSHWHVMQCAQGHVTVLLDGQGGDEVLGGYTEFYPAYLASLWRNMLFLKSPFDAYARSKELLRGLDTYLGGSNRFKREAIAKFLPSFIRSSVASVREKDTLFSEDFLMKYRSQSQDSREESALLNALPSLLDQDMYKMFVETNLPMLLRYEDRNSMAFSLEARTPFLDYRLVEFSLGLNYREKMRGYTTKWILRESLKDLLPREIYERKDKKGFPTPLALWMRGTLKEEMTKRIENGAFSAIVKPDTAKRLLQEHLSGTMNHERTLFRLLTLDIWMRMYL